MNLLFFLAQPVDRLSAERLGLQRLCLDRVMRELRRTWAQHGDLFDGIRAYNGSGHNASIYAQNVLAYSGFAGEVGGAMPA